MTNEQLDTSTTSAEFIGSAGSYTHFYKGFIYSFDYYEFAKAVTTVNTACEDLDTNSTPDCPFCLGDNTCLNKCAVNEWDDSGACTDCTPGAGEVCNATGTATAGCSGCTCTQPTCAGGANCDDCGGTTASDCWSCAPNF